MLPRFLRLFVAACLVVGVACTPEARSTCTGTDVRLVSAGRLTVAADYSYPPFAFRGRDGDLVGFEVELVKLIAKEMKLEASFVNRGASALVTGVLAHSHDVSASGLRATDGLREQTCLSSSYLDADLGVLVAKTKREDIGGADDLGGRTVAVLDGSAAEDWGLENLDRSTLASLPTTDDLLTALRQDRADAVVADLPFARFSQMQSRDFTVAARLDTGEEYVFAAAPDNAPLVRGIDDAIARLQANGRLGKVRTKWFGS